MEERALPNSLLLAFYPMSKKLTRRRSLYLGLGALTALATFTGNAELKRQRILALNDPQRDFRVVGGASLKEHAASIGLIYGAAIRHDHLRQDAKLAAWALKWSTPKNPLRPNPDSFDFSAADEMLEFAHTHGMLFRGHTLVWHESLPDWFASNVNYQNAKQILEKHINTVVGRYAGKIHSWDVVNEAIEPRDGRSDGLRKTPWLKLLGTDYIDYAFRLAAAADPQAILVYNDYGLDYDTSEDEAKRNAVLKLFMPLVSKHT